VTTVVSIVEGDGEVMALPVLLRRLCEWTTPQVQPLIASPIRVRRDRFVQRDEEFRRFMLLAAAKCGTDGWILLLLDADDDCPATFGPALLERARSIVGHQRISVVLANREYEAWFIAAAPSLTGVRGFAVQPGDHQVEAERPRNAKGWIRERMPGGIYGPTTDQAAFSARMDLRMALDRSRSFRKLCDEWMRQSAAIGGPVIGPT
jgi:hypothetical protein